MLTEINFYKCLDGQRKTGLGRLKRELAGGGFSAGASNQISLMKWVILWNRTSRKQRHPCLCFLKLPSVAIFFWLLTIS